jgi:hypothetical protein
MLLVFGSFGRRAFEAVVATFALLGFFFVPLGRHTGFEHARAVFSTPAAGQALRELGQAALGLRDRLLGAIGPEPERPQAAPAGPRQTQPSPTPPPLR